MQVGLHCKVEWQKHIFRIVKSQAPDVKNISLNNKIIPCAKLVIIIEQGIISLVKWIFLTPGACELNESTSVTHWYAFLYIDIKKYTDYISIDFSHQHSNIIRWATDKL